MAAELAIHREATDSRVMLRLGGVFNADAAAALQEALEAEDKPVVVDFSRVREFYDFAVGLLANGILRHTSRVSLSGLNDHQRRMFRSFGVDPSARAIHPVELPLDS